MYIYPFRWRSTFVCICQILLHLRVLHVSTTYFVAFRFTASPGGSWTPVEATIVGGPQTHAQQGTHDGQNLRATIQAVLPRPRKRQRTARKAANKFAVAHAGDETFFIIFHLPVVDGANPEAEAWGFEFIIIISFAIRQFQMNPTKPSFDMTILYSYRDECTLNTNQLTAV